MARLQRARPGAGARPGRAAAGALQVPRDLHEQPGRVLHGPGGDGPGRPRVRPPAVDPGQARAGGRARPHPRARHGAHGRADPHLARGAEPRARRGGHPGDGLRRPGRRRAPRRRRALRPRGLPRAHAAGRGPRAALPVHLGPVAQPRPARARPREGGDPVRARQGAPAPAAPDPGRRPAGLHRGRHRGPRGAALPGHGGGRDRAVPGDARRGLLDLRRVGRPHRRGRGPAAPAPVRPRGAAGGRGGGARTA